MVKIFLSYRRDDTGLIVGRVHERLEAHFGDGSVFVDIDRIPPGADFRKHLTDVLAQSHVLVALIGERWLEKSSNGERRIDSEGDYVRIEIETALTHGIPVVPLLVGKTLMPDEDQLPTAIRQLAFRQAAKLDSVQDFHAHMDRLISQLESLGVQTEPQRPPSKGKRTRPSPTASDLIDLTDSLVLERVKLRSKEFDGRPFAISSAHISVSMLNFQPPESIRYHAAPDGAFLALLAIDFADSDEHGAFAALLPNQFFDPLYVDWKAKRGTEKTHIVDINGTIKRWEVAPDEGMVVLLVVDSARIPSDTKRGITKR